MVDAEYYIRKYGLNKAEVEEWGKKHYPEFAKNLALIAQLYLIKVKGIKPKPPIRADKIKKVATLQEGERAIIKVVVTLLVGERAYLGCPICKKRVSDSNMCPNCGVVEPKEYKWVTYHAGDDTGEVILNFPPGVSEDLRDLTGAIILAVGRYRAGEFIVENYDILEETQRQVSHPEPATECEADLAESDKAKEENQPLENISVEETEEATSVQPAEVQQDVEKGKVLVKYFKGQTISEEEYRSWKQRMKIKTPDDILFRELGLERRDDGRIFIRGREEEES